MKRNAGVMVLTMALVAAPLAWAGSATTKVDKVEAAKTAELKGDLAGIHKNYSAAVLDFVTAIHFTPHNASLYNKLGIAELQMRDHGAASKAFKNALKYDTNNAAAYNNLGALAYLDKKYNPAIKYLKQALALDESNASAHLNMAESWAGLGQMDRAMTEYARALELNADILSDSQEGVIAQVKTPEQRARISYLIAKAYAKRGNVEGALEFLRRARDGGFKELNRVYADPDFATVVQDPRLQKIVKK